MPITKVNSSMLWAVDYDRKTKTLEVAFRKGGIFRYTDVPYAAYRELLKANSIGSHMRSHIIGIYPEFRLD